MSSTTRRMRRIAGVLVAGALLAGVSACAADAEPASNLADAGAEGVDDGSTLTLWTRAPLEKQANLLVDAYNESHENQVELTVVPNDDYVAKVGAAAGSNGLPDLFAADIVYVPNWVEQGLFQDITANIDGLDFKDEINAGHLSAGTLDDKEYVLPFVLDLSMLFWNKDLVDRGRPRRRGRARRTSQEFAECRQGHPGAEQARHVRHRHGPELRRMPRVHLVPERVGRRRGGASPTTAPSRCSRATPPRRSTPRGRTSGTRAPCSRRRRTRPVPPGPRASPRARSASMFYPATLLSSTPFDVGRRRHPRPRGRRVDVRRR